MVSKPTTAPKQKSQFRTQLSQQYRQRKRAANTSNNATIQYSLGPAPKLKSVFDATPFRTLATPESNLLQNTLLDTELTDTVTSTNLVLSESGKYIDQGWAYCVVFNVSCDGYTPVETVLLPCYSHHLHIKCVLHGMSDLRAQCSSDFDWKRC